MERQRAHGLKRLGCRVETEQEPRGRCDRLSALARRPRVLTRRTFSRYFTDKRDVLFAGSERLPELLGEALRRADLELTAFAALLTALADVGAVLGAQVATHAVQRREVIAHSPELQERGRTKFAAVADALAAALVDRGSEPAGARLLADVGVAILRTGFDRWEDNPDSDDLRSSRQAETATAGGSSLGTPEEPRKRTPRRR